ncbi:MAG: Ni/Fe hydrogenase subunit alpha [Candidatus Methanoperedens sp.]|nr:Ni/Fe hydrogenase subunit alpha [Candidatus Methanoperedens sp.]
MSREVKINLEHVSRIEGHGNIVMNSKNGKIQSIKWQVPEAPRFFEKLLTGRDYQDISHIASRICGICSIAHSLASLKASENAMGVVISDQTILLRKLALHAENIQSHILHVGYLAAPDLFGVGSIFPLIKTNRNAVTDIIKLHRLANEMSELICGRTTHPITLKVGGFTKIPAEEGLISLEEKLNNSFDIFRDVSKTILANIDKLPNFERETEYIGLVSDKEYALYDGMIGSTDTGMHDIDEYLSITNEFVVPHSTAKYTEHMRESYMVGALARFNLNNSRIKQKGKEVAENFGLESPCFNPFMNNVAQLVEVAHCLEDSIYIINRLIDRGLHDERVQVEVSAGRGIGAVEAPRGILFHDYVIDEDGKCIKANCIIPTNQNHANIQKDMEAFAPTLLHKSRDEIEHNLEMLVRAYDPCISCSTH